MRMTDAYLRLDRLRRLLDTYDTSWVRRVMSEATERGQLLGRNYVKYSTDEELAQFVAWYDMTDDYTRNDLQVDPMPELRRHRVSFSNVYQLECHLLGLPQAPANLSQEVCDAYEDRYRLAYRGVVVSMARDVLAQIDGVTV